MVILACIVAVLVFVGGLTIALCVLSSRLSRQEEDRWGLT